MTETNSKAKAFFDQADQVAETGNWDYAIEMYSEGIRRDPENIERGFKKLRDVALKRKARGGKGPGFGDKRKHPTNTKEPVDNLANAAFLFAKDPGNNGVMEQLLSAAWKANLPDVLLWIGEIMMEVQRQAAKPNKRICVSLIDAFEAFEMYKRAVGACGLALQASPGNAELEGRLGDLGARYTLQKGQYGQEGDFTKGIKDFDKQKELLQKDSIVKGKDHLKQQIEKARKEYEQSPEVTGKVNAYVDALLKFEEDEYENQAVQVLEKAWKDAGAYQFKMRIGDIRIRQLSRRFRQLRDAGKTEEAKRIARKQLAFEIQEYAERVKNYPTELGLKYELGRRLFVAGKYDDAIGMFQQAQRDPRRHVTCMSYLGQAFMKKQWWQEAVDTFNRLLQGDLSEDRAKEIRYYLAQCLEQLGKLAEAEEQFSAVAQIDFNFRDTRQCLERVRQKKAESGETG
jgi:tetratricopeptide (TPR) repeat protein